MPMKTLFKIAVAFAFLVAFLESVIAAAKWWRGGELVWWEWLLAGALPLLIALYLRCFSIFGCGRGQCLLPPDDPNPPSSHRHEG